jgi:hypothetical protein
MTDNPAKADDADEAEAREAEENFDDDDYVPGFIDKLLKNPSLLPPEYREDFGSVFEEFECTHLGRAKTALEYILVNEATKLVLNLERYERMKGAIFLNEQRAAVETLFRKTHDGAAMQNAGPGLRAVAHLDAKKYFSDQTFKAKADRTFEAAGYAPDAIEGETFLRALPSLSVIEKQIASAQKRLIGILKELEARYSSRDKEKKMTVFKRVAKKK